MRRPKLLAGVLLAFGLLQSVPALADDPPIGYIEVRDEGTSLRRRRRINFVGASVSAADDTTNAETDVTIVGGSGNSFETIDVPAGTDPVADSSTDTLTITETTPFAITGTAGTDTINLTVDAGADFDSSGLIEADSVALSTDTTGNYAAGDAEAGSALTGDSATSFFSAGQIEAARGGTGDDTSATTGIARIDLGNWTYGELSGDVVTSGSNATVIQANSVALGTDTTGNYAAGDAEAGNALTGDSATSFFSAGQIEAARGGTGDDTSATTGIARVDSGNWTYAELSGDVTTSGSNATTIQANSIALTTDTTGDYVATVADGTGIDGTATGEGSTYTPTLDLTEISTATWGAGNFSDLKFDTAGDDYELSIQSSVSAWRNTTDRVTAWIDYGNGMIGMGEAGWPATKFLFVSDGTGDGELQIPSDSVNLSSEVTSSSYSSGSILFSNGANVAQDNSNLFWDDTNNIVRVSHAIVGTGEVGTPVAGTLRGANASGTNVAGAATTIAAGLGTGTGTLGTLSLQAAIERKSSGSSAHDISTILTIGHPQSSHPGTAGGVINAPAVIWRDENTAASGTAAAAVSYAFQVPTFRAKNSGVTITDAGTFYIAGAPEEGNNATITNPWSLWVDTGNVRLDGSLSLGSTKPGTSRLALSGGTSVTTGDWALSGWGANATVSAVTGNDSRGTVTVATSALDTPSLNPTVTLTFKNGTWTAVPFAVTCMNNDTTGPFASASCKTTATTLILEYDGTPTALTAANYVFNFIVVG